MNGVTILGGLVKQCGPLLFSPRSEDFETVRRRLQILSAEPIRQCSCRNGIVTPCIFQDEEVEMEQPNETQVSQVSDKVSTTDRPQKAGEVHPLQTVLWFASAENVAANKQHIFELSAFLQLLRQPPTCYTSSVFWSMLIRRLGELRFYEMLKANIEALWAKVCGQSPHGREAFGPLRLLQISCDVVLHYSDHAAHNYVDAKLLGDFAALAHKMWAENLPVMVRRCALVISAFLTKFADLVPLASLSGSNCEMERDAPHWFAAIAKVPALFKADLDVVGDDLRVVLQVVFTSTAYSIPITTFFRGEGPLSASLLLVQRNFATAVHQLLSVVSYVMWDHFSTESLLSLLEASAMYSRLWNSFPCAVAMLLTRICNNTLAVSSKIHMLSLFNYCISAAAYHCTVGELGDVTHRYGAGEGSHSRRPLSATQLQTTGGDRGCITQRPQDGFVSEGNQNNCAAAHTEVSVTLLLRESFRLMITGWSSYRSSDRGFLRSSLIMLHDLLFNYPYQLGELGGLVGFDMDQLLHGIVTGLLAGDVDNAQIMETVYSIVFRFYEVFGVPDVVSNLLQPRLIGELGLRVEATEKALMQVQLYKALLETRDKEVSPIALVEASTHIDRGAILRFPLVMSFFIKWFTATEKLLLSQPREVLCGLLSGKGVGVKFVHCLCEGILALVRELQSGNVVVDGVPVAPLLEGVITCVSAAVLHGDQQNALATCVISVHGECDVSASFMLFCLVFAANAGLTLLESAARLLACVVERSEEGLFSTIRVHTSIEVKKRLLTELYCQLGSANTADDTGARAVRLAALHHVLRFDPAAFYYLMAPEDTGEKPTELGITLFLRDLVKSQDSSPLEKSEAFAFLKTLNDTSVSVADTKDLLSNMQVDSPTTRGVLTATAVHYACNNYFHRSKSDGGGHEVANASKVTLSRLRLSECLAGGAVQERGPICSSDEARWMLELSCKSLRECIALYKEITEELRYENITDVSLNDSNSSEYLPMVTSVMENAEGSRRGIGLRHQSLVDPRQMCNGQTIFVSCLLPGDDILVWGEPTNKDLDRLVSSLVAIVHISASIETLLWVSYGEKEVEPVALQLLESALCVVQMLRSLPPQLEGFASKCLDGALTIAHTVTAILTRISGNGDPFVHTPGLNALLAAFVRTLACHRDNDDIILRGLRILSLFKPVEMVDEEVVISIFDLVAYVIERHAATTPNDFLTPIVAEITVIFTNVGAFCPMKWALCITNSLWVCTVNLSQMIVASDTSSVLSDKFDTVVQAVKSVFLHCEGILRYFTGNQIMLMAVTLGQLSNATCYDSPERVCKPYAWHRAWLSVLWLLHTVLIGCSDGDACMGTWVSMISSWATTSPRFREAVSGFTYRRDGTRWGPGPQPWEWREMHAATSIVTLLSSLGASTVSLTPHVQRCFCRVRHFSSQTTSAQPDVSLSEIFVATVRLQLSYFIQQSPPSGSVEGGPTIVAISRYRPLTGGDIRASGGLLSQQPSKTKEENEKEEQLSFYNLRCFIFRELSILRKSCREDSSAAGVLHAPDHTPLLRCASLNTSTDGFSDIDVREGSVQAAWPHLVNVQLALILFVRNCHFHVFERCLDFREETELVEGVNELHHVLNLLAYYARRLESPRLVSVVKKVREQLCGITERLKGLAS